MEFAAWLTANGYDAEKLPDNQRKHLENSWKFENQPTAKPETGTFDQKLEAIAAEERRIQSIRDLMIASCEKHRGDPDKIGQLRSLCEAAVADKKTDFKDFQLAMLRAGNKMGPMVLTPSGKAQIDESVLEAAVAQSVGIPKLDKLYSDQVLQAAHTRFRRGIQLKELLCIAAERNNGWRGSPSDEHALCKAAFGRQHGEMYADAMPTTVSVPGILSNVANKQLDASFNYAEDAWRSISKVRPLRDFKQVSMYRLDGAAKFKKVPPGGELKAAKLSELSYTLQADTYGAYLGLDRRDIINDDLGAFAGAADILARGAADSLNEVFWTEWLDDSAFFNTDKSKLNYDDGATDSVLTLAGLDNAYTIFNQQTKADSTPMGTEPRILLVPINLKMTARSLMNGTVTAAAQSTATVTVNNPFSGTFDVVASRYLSNSSITGYSTTAWYLLADPNDIPAINVGFLNGVDRPTVETGQFDFQQLGLAMRAYMDWGCKKGEYRAGLKLKGAA